MVAGSASSAAAAPAGRRRERSARPPPASRPRCRELRRSPRRRSPPGRSSRRGSTATPARTAPARRPPCPAERRQLRRAGIRELGVAPRRAASAARGQFGRQRVAAPAVRIHRLGEPGEEAGRRPGPRRCRTARRTSSICRTRRHRALFGGVQQALPVPGQRLGTAAIRRASMATSSSVSVGIRSKTIRTFCTGEAMTFSAGVRPARSRTGPAPPRGARPARRGRCRRRRRWTRPTGTSRRVLVTSSCPAARPRRRQVVQPGFVTGYSEEGRHHRALLGEPGDVGVRQPIDLGLRRDGCPVFGDGGFVGIRHAGRRYRSSGHDAVGISSMVLVHDGLGELLRPIVRGVGRRRPASPDPGRRRRADKRPGRSGARRPAR